MDDCPFGGEPGRERPADPGRRARDEGDLAREPAAHRVTAPSEAGPTLRAYLARTPRSTRAVRGARTRRARRELRRRQLDLEPACLHIDGDDVAVAEQPDRAVVRGLRGHVADHEPAGRSAEATVGDERHALAEAATGDRGRDREQLRHSRPAGRALSAHDDDVARRDPAVLDGASALGLRVEDPRGPAMERPLVARELHDGSPGREIPPQDAKCATLLERRSRGGDHVAVRLGRGRADLADRPAVDRHGVAGQVLGEPADQRGCAAGALQVCGDVRPSG